jgi:hypothetical protein
MVGLAVAVALLLAGAAPARAGFVVPNSTFDVVPIDGGDGLAFFTFTVNGTPQNFSYHGTQVTVTESETSLGGGQSKLLIELTATQDIFPNPGTSAGLNIGASPTPSS